MDFAKEKIDGAMLTLSSLVERIRAEAGCIDCSVYLDTEFENRVVLLQKWRTESDLNRHLRSEEYKMVLLIIETAISPPMIMFDTISSTSGVEIIEEARKVKKD